MIKKRECPEEVRETMKCPRCGSKLVTSWNWLDCLSCRWTCKAYTREPLELAENLDMMQKNIGDDEENFGY